MLVDYYTCRGDDHILKRLIIPIIMLLSSSMAFQAPFPVHLPNSTTSAVTPVRHSTLTHRVTPTSPHVWRVPHVQIHCSQPVPTAAPPSSQSSPPPLPTSPLRETAYPKPVGTPGAFAALANDCETVPQLFAKLAVNPQLADSPALIDDHHGPPVTLTFAQLGHAIDICTRALRLLGLQPRDIVSLFSESSYRWCVIDQSIMRCGAAAAVRGVAAPKPELRFIFDNSRSTALFVEDRAALLRIIESGADLTALKFVIVLFGSAIECAQIVPPGVRLSSYDELMVMGSSITPDPVNDMDAPVISRSDMATMLYTSGTTGNPKGVVLTHNNLLCQLSSISLGNLDPHPGEVFVSILPCWHVFERTACYWSLSKGVNVVYSNKRSFRDDLVKYRPHMLISVPRVFENLHATIMSRLRKASAFRKALFAFFFAVSLMFVKSRRRVTGLDISGKSPLVTRLINALRMTVLAPLYGLANLLIWRKIRAGVGGRLRICLSGGGRIAGYLEDFFECAGIDICVGYGLTETSPVIANRFGERNVRGSTGIPLRGLEIKIVDTDSNTVLPTGEVGVLHVRGPTVFREYWENSEAAAKAFDAEGYFDTGDLAYISHGGDVVISGRSKDLIVLSNGENIEPASIEDAVLGSNLIDQVMLVGQDERTLGALIVPELAELEEAGVVSNEFRMRVKELLKQAGGKRTEELRQAERELSSNGVFAKAIKEEIQDKNQERPSYSGNDNIVPIRALLVPFSVDNGMMTQTLKIKKDVVCKVYELDIADMFKRV